MQLAECVLLRHETDGKSHFDFMIEDLDGEKDPDNKCGLMTWRVALSDEQWADSASFPMTRLPNHRRIYLTYEGRISGGRGTVIRVDQGNAKFEDIGSDEMTIALRMRDFAGRLRICRATPNEAPENIWQGKVLEVFS